jgi:hypothetical protein
MPAARIQTLFVNEFGVRQTAGYDIKDSGWQPTDASRALLHERAGSRSPAETARVQPFLRGLATRLDQAEFMLLTQQACQTWQARYRADRTPLVLGNLDELAAMVRWAVAAGLPTGCLEIRVPKDDFESALDVSAVSRNLEAWHECGSVEVVASAVPLARSQYRSQGRQRIGFILRENSMASLTQMNQFHRVMHVLSAWLSL